MIPERLILPVKLNAHEVDDILIIVIIVVDVDLLLPLFQAIDNPTVVAIACLYEGYPAALLGIIGSSWPESKGEYEAGEIFGVVEADADQVLSW